jgi:putative transposase
MEALNINAGNKYGIFNRDSRSSRLLQQEFPALRKRYWGQHLWARGYYCASVGAVDERTIREYIENQRWDEDVDGFTVTAPTEP